MQRLWQDLRYAARTFVRNPGFVTIASISLALGIGANAAMVALVNTLLNPALTLCGGRPVGQAHWRVP